MAAHPDTGTVDVEEGAALLMDLLTVLLRVGGVFQVGAHRTEIEPGQFETTHLVVQWESYAPAQRQKADPGEEEGEDGAPAAEQELEPVGSTG